MTKRWSFVLVLAATAGCRGDGAEQASTADATTTDSQTTTTTTDSQTTATTESTDTGTTGGELEPLAIEFVEIPWAGPPPYEITDMRFIPGTSELLLLSKPGIFHHYEIIDDEAVELGWFEIPDTFPNNDCGLLSIAFDPAFEENSVFFAGACVDHDYSAVFRYVWNPDDYAAVVASRTQIILEGDTDAEWPWHNVGSIGFFSDETMWVGFGDKTVDGNGQDLTKNLGKMLRILPDRDPAGPGGYQPAPGNPFPENPDLWAYGLRVPFRTVVDDRDRLIVSDVGQVDWEEINLIDEPGLNFGWAIVEGPCEGNCDALVDPLVSFPHDVHEYALDDPDVIPTARWVVWVSPFYDPLPELDRYDGRLTKRLLFGDMCSGWVQALGLDEDGNIDYIHHAGHMRHAPAWAVGPDGYMYAVASGGCANIEFDDAPAAMYRVVLAAD